MEAISNTKAAAGAETDTSTTDAGWPGELITMKEAVPALVFFFLRFFDFDGGRSLGSFRLSSRTIRALPHIRTKHCYLCYQGKTNSESINPGEPNGLQQLRILLIGWRKKGKSTANLKLTFWLLGSQRDLTVPFMVIGPGKVDAKL